MSDALGAPIGEQRTRRPLTATYLRFVALLLLAAGLARACQILGITPDGSDFSDLAPAWRTAAAGLLLVNLFAAVGLWVAATWGAVMWAVAFAVEFAMHTLFADIFGRNILRIAIHGALFAGFLALAFMDWRREVEE